MSVSLIIFSIHLKFILLKKMFFKESFRDHNVKNRCFVIFWGRIPTLPY